MTESTTSCPCAEAFRGAGATVCEGSVLVMLAAANSGSARVKVVNMRKKLMPPDWRRRSSVRPNSVLVCDGDEDDQERQQAERIQPYGPRLIAR